MKKKIEEKLNRCPLVNGAEVTHDTCRVCCFSKAYACRYEIKCNFEFKINKGAEESK